MKTASAADAPVDGAAKAAMAGTMSATGAVFRIEPARAAAGRLVFASPHSGRSLPADDALDPDLTAASLMSAEDVLVDRLCAAGPDHGAPLIAALISRNHVDLNRARGDLDPEVVEGCGPAVGPRAAAGYGVIPRLAGDGRRLHMRRLTAVEAEARLARVHDAYHAALAGLMEAARAAGRGRGAVLIDWHSMPARALGRARSGRLRTDGAGPGAAGRIDIVIGDRHGASAAPALSRRVRALLDAQGFRTALNRPYAGGWTTERWGRPAEGFQAVQLEIRRDLFLDAATGAPGPGFVETRARLDRFIAALAQAEG